MNGSSFTASNGNCFDINFDYNADNPPNEYGRDKFKFLICSPDKNECAGGKFCGAWFHYWNTKTRETSLSMCSTDPKFCAQFLQWNNWEFPNDYPHKL